MDIIFKIQHEMQKGSILLIKSIEGNNSHNCYFDLYPHNELVCIDRLNGGYDSYCSLPIGNWELIGLTKDISEQEAQYILDSKKTDYGVEMYNIYTSDKNWLDESALQSFKSLMTHLKIYEINPYGVVCFDVKKNYPNVEIRQQMIDRWLYAEKRTGKWIVLFKPND